MPHAAYVFDAYGTLFDVHSAVRRLAAEIGPAGQRVSEIWRAKQLEYTWVRSLMSGYRDFRALTEAALDIAIAAAAPESAALKPKLLDAYRHLDAYPDVRPALARIRQAGARTFILSNGTAEMLAEACAGAGIGELFDGLISADEVQVYKTSARVYALAEERAGARGTAIAFLSSNRWDVAGAVRHGFTGIWVNRTSQPDEYPDLAPQAVIGSLAELKV
jgi:2-haloacid dehalogenase